MWPRGLVAAGPDRKPRRNIARNTWSESHMGLILYIGDSSILGSSCNILHPPKVITLL